MKRLAVLLVASSACLACSPSREGERAPAAPRVAESDATAAFEAGERSFRKKQWNEAELRYREVETRFGDSPYAKRAKLRLADIAFARRRWRVAIDAYDRWIAAYRGDPLVPKVRERANRARCVEAELGACLEDEDPAW